MIYGNVLRNGTYPISVSSERIFQALAIARYANEIGADAIAHGSTGAGNDQIRFDMTFLVCAPGVEIITVTRDMTLTREFEVNYLNEHGFKADFAKLKYSYNVGLWGTSICGGEILDSKQGLPDSAYLKQVKKEGEEELHLTYENGELKAVIGGSPNIIFDEQGNCRSDLINSYDDDYLVLYAVIEVFILTLNSQFLK